MKIGIRKKYEYESFIKLMPYINAMLKKVKLTDKTQEYKFNEIPFLMRFNKFENAVEMSLARERPIFPTLMFATEDEGSVKLLYYRVSVDFRDELNKAMDDGWHRLNNFFQ